MGARPRHVKLIEMVGTVEEQACWTLPAVPDTARQLRVHVKAFATAAGAPPPELHDAVALAVSETVTNAVVHAYAGARETGIVRMRCWVSKGRLVVEVSDDGVGMARRDDSPGIGHGLAIVGAVAEALDVAPGPGGRGTVVTMTFAAGRAPERAPGLEALCRLALETVADVSCVDVVRGGVLRRVAGEVAGDAGLTGWLREATPPAKPGTATWAALREGGPHLVVHDPAVPRSPGGTGEILGLEWWLAVPLEGPAGAPEALWGLGGRAGGRPAPPAAIRDALGDAAHGDLADETQRAALRERLRAALNAPSDVVGVPAVSSGRRSGSLRGPRAGPSPWR
jgi:serine/threonine-protein kinase RsbW